MCPQAHHKGRVCELLLLAAAAVAKKPHWMQTHWVGALSSAMCGSAGDKGSCRSQPVNQLMIPTCKTVQLLQVPNARVVVCRATLDDPEFADLIKKMEELVSLIHFRWPLCLGLWDVGCGRRCCHGMACKPSTMYARMWLRHAGHTPHDTFPIPRCHTNGGVVETHASQSTCTCTISFVHRSASHSALQPIMACCFTANAGRTCLHAMHSCTTIVDDGCRTVPCAAHLFCSAHHGMV